MSQKQVVLITGANAGIGYQTVLALLRSSTPYDIIVSGRTPAKVETAIKAAREEVSSPQSELHALEVDIESDESVAKAFETVSAKFDHIDVLINNAGGAFDLDLHKPDNTLTPRAMFNKTWNLNVTSTHIFTNTFAPLLLSPSKTPSSSPRLLFLASGTSSLTNTENPSIIVNKVSPPGWPKPQSFSVPAYRSSKTGLNMLMREWYRTLREDGVKVWGVSPGFLATGLGGMIEDLRKAGAGEPSLGGEMVRRVVEGEFDGEVGKVVMKDGVQPW